MRETDTPLRLALIGCGALAELYYAPALAAVAGSSALQVAVLVDPDEKRRARLGRWFPAARQVGDDAMMAAGEVDLAILASPPRFHAAQAERLLLGGVHVLCEKPMATSGGEARRMMGAAKAAQRLLAVGMFRRFFPTAQHVKDLVTGGALGAARSFVWSEGGVFNWPAATPSFFQKTTSGGGVLADVGPHVLDLLLWWFGAPTGITCEDDAMGGVEANVRLRLAFAGGVEGTVRLSRDTRVPVETRVEFERGTVAFAGASADTLMMDLQQCSYVARSNLHLPAKQRGMGPGAPAAGYARSFMAQLENFAAAARGREALRVRTEEAVAVQELIEHCYRIRRPMALPWLTAVEQAGATRLAGAEAPIKS